jgi:hypothetical protein
MRELRVCESKVRFARSPAGKFQPMAQLREPRDFLEQRGW